MKKIILKPAEGNSQRSKRALGFALKMKMTFFEIFFQKFNYVRGVTLNLTLIIYRTSLLHTFSMLIINSSYYCIMEL